MKNVNNIINKEFFNSHIIKDWIFSSYNKPPDKIGREIKTVIYIEVIDKISSKIRQRLRNTI